MKTPKNIEIQNFEPKKMGRAYVCVKISEYPPWAPPPPPPPSTPSLLTEYFRRRKMWHLPKYCPNGNGIFHENFKRYVYRKNKKK